MNLTVKETKSNATQAIQEALDKVFLNGGGTVEIEAGVYDIKSIRIRSNTTLYLKSGAHLRGSRNPEDYFTYLNDTVEPLNPDQITDAPYVGLWTIHGETHYDENDPRYRFKRKPGSRWNNALIRAIDAENIKIIGEEGSIIDGNNCYDAIGEEDYRGPHAITFFNVKNVIFKGYTIQHSSNWAHNMLFCDNITVEGIKVLAGHDGFDAAVCRNITISNCEFFTGDDCIAGFGNTNVFISGCVLNSSCSAFRFGGSNVYVRDCHIQAPGKYSFRNRLSLEDKMAGVTATPDKTRNNMLSAFTYYADYSVPIPEQPCNIVLKDCVIDGADRFLHYNFSGNETWQRYRPLTDIRFENIKATRIAMPLMLYGTEEIPVELTLKNIEIEKLEGAGDEPLMKACNFSRITMENVNITGNAGDCLILAKSQGETVFKNVTCNLQESDYVKMTNEEFNIETI